MPKNHKLSVAIYISYLVYIMTWNQLISRLLTLGKSRDEIADVIRGMVDEGLITQDEADARIRLLDGLVNINSQPVMIVRTETGSIYEVDRKNKRVRRLTGEKNPTPRMGKDGEWKTYHDIQPDPPELDVPLLIVWETPAIAESDQGDDMVEIKVPTTLTSLVVAINPPLS
jgi:hypothetical protein